MRLSVASGWHPDDFILAPDNYHNRKEILINQLKLLKKIWKEHLYTGKNGKGDIKDVRLYPLPPQQECPLWITIANDAALFIEAGKLGLNILTHLMFQDIAQLHEKIEIYHKALIENGFNTTDHHITVMLHTYIHEADGVAELTAQEPLISYFKSHMQLVTKISNTDSISDDIDEAYFIKLTDKFINERSLIGTSKKCMRLVEKLKKIGVTEIACLVDYGISEEKILESIENISLLKNKTSNITAGLYNPGKIKKYLENQLVEYMIPNQFIVIDNFPLTSHGKIDYEELAHLFKQKNKQTCIIKSKPIKNNATTDILIDLWYRILKISPIDVDQSFFEAGGHSLNAIELLNMIKERFNVHISIGQFIKNPTITHIINLLNNGSPEKKIDNAQIKTAFITPMQKGIWAFCQLFPQTTCYHDAFLYEVLQPVTINHFMTALEKILDEDPIFKVSFTEENNQLIQKVNQQAPKPSLIHYAYSAPLILENDPMFYTEINKNIQQPFLLNTPSLIRVIVYQFTDKCFLQLVIHHIITDGKSLSLLLDRISKALVNEPTQIIKNYLDYIASETLSQTTDADRKPKIDTYIQEMKLQNIYNSLNFTNGRPSARTFKGFSHNIIIAKEDFNNLKNIAKSNGVTINTILLATYAKSLLQHCNQPTLQVGSAISLRDTEWQDCFGLFVNFGVIAYDKIETEQWNNQTWANETQKRSMLMLENRDIHFSDLTSQLNTNLLTHSQPLFQFAFNSFEEINNTRSIFKKIFIDYGISRFDLELQAENHSDSIDITFIFSNDIFNSNTAQFFLSSFNNHLKSFITSKQQGILNYWEGIYDNLYSKIDTLAQSTMIGWNSAITGEPIPTIEMKDWLDDIIKKITRIPVGDVLEIGCGTGLVLSKLKNSYNSYLGIDFSSVIISKLSNQYINNNTTFKLMLADNIYLLSPMKFDLIILNSVIQYFPDTTYLEKVLKQAIDLLKPNGGRIILGDIRNLDWKKHYSACLLNSNDIIIENELFVDPSYFLSLYKNQHNITILAEPKYMKITNELSRFRYDISLLTNHDQRSNDSGDSDFYQIDGSSLKNIDEIMRLAESHIHDKYFICITNLLNKRIFEDEKSIDITNLHNSLNQKNIKNWIILDPKKAEKIILLATKNQSISMPKISTILFQSLTSSTTLSETKKLPTINNSIIADKKQITQQLKNIWKVILHHENIQHDDNFLALGGDSIRYLKLYKEILNLGFNINITDLLSRQVFKEQLSFLINIYTEQGGYYA